jgi:hypothetical protein
MGDTNKIEARLRFLKEKAVANDIAKFKASLKGDKGDKGDPGPPGPQGPQGEQGEPGDKPRLGIDYFVMHGRDGADADTSRVVPYIGATGNVNLGSNTLNAGGIEIGTTSDNVSIDSSGEMVFNGDATVWDDLRITPGSFDRPGASDPTYVLYYPNGGAIGTYALQFAKDNIASFTVQLPHGYKQGSNIFIHLHWNTGVRGAQESGSTVGWKVDYCWANINGVFDDMQVADLSDTCDGVAHKHLMTPEVQITGTNKHISSMLICNIRRSDTGTDDTWTGTASGQLPILLEVDFHYEIDTVGSKTQSSK